MHACPMHGGMESGAKKTNEQGFQSDQIGSVKEGKTRAAGDGRKKRRERERFNRELGGKFKKENGKDRAGERGILLSSS